MHDTIINTNCNITQYMAILMAVLLPRVTLVIGYVTACIQSCAHIRETPWALKPRQEKTVCQLRICQRLPLRVRASLCGVLLHVLLHCAVVRECGVFAGHEAPSPSPSALRGHKRAPSGLSCVCHVVLYNIGGGGGRGYHGNQGQSHGNCDLGCLLSRKNSYVQTLRLMSRLVEHV